MTADPSAYAAAYITAGFHVAPITPGTKYPPMNDWVEQATNNPAQAQAWWQGPYTGYGVCIAPRQLPDGRWLFVVDVDMHGVDGLTVWSELCADNGGIETTVEAITGGGGTHLLYASPREIRNWTLVDVDTSAIQLRGNGGQIVVEPSIHKDTGRVYQWVDGQAPWDVPVADAPRWLLALIADDTSTRVTRPPRVPQQADTDRPGDQWAAATDWAMILERDGWTLHHVDRTGEEHWTRPGKTTREGTSATVNYMGTDTLKVFTSSVPGLTQDATYTKIGYLAATRFQGDHSAAATALADQGFRGTRLADYALDPPQAPPRPPTATQTATQAPEPHGTTWPAPQPLPAAPPPPEWPRDVLPDWMQNQVDNVTRQIVCAPDLPGMFALGALTVMSLGRIEVAVRAGHTEPTTMYLIAAAPPSEGKSAALEMMMEPVNQLEERWIDMAAKDVATAQARKAIADKKAKELADNAARDDSDERMKAAMKAREAAEAIEVPAAGRLTTSDVTPEQLAILMQANGERMAVVSDESGILTVDRYGRKDRGSNMDIYLSAWSGRKVTVDRVTAPAVRLKKPLLSIVAGVQPDAWHDKVLDPEFRSRGLGARFMAVTPIPRGHTRNVDLERDDWDTDVAATYQSRMTALGATWHQWQHPATAHISKAAKREWTTWAQPLQTLQGPGQELHDEAAWVSKMKDTVLRVSVLLHLAEGHGVQAEIGAETMRRACVLGDYWIGHRLHNRTDEYDDARLLLASLARLAVDNGGVVTERMIGRSGPSKLRRIEAHAPVIAVLAAYGWVQVDTALPAGMATDPVGMVRSATGIRVHPDAQEAAATPSAIRDKTQPTVVGVHGESTFVADCAMSRIRHSEGYLSTDFDGFTENPDPPRDNRDNPTIRHELTEPSVESETVHEPSTEPPPWSLLD